MTKIVVEGPRFRFFVDLGFHADDASLSSSALKFTLLYLGETIFNPIIDCSQGWSTVSSIVPRS